MLGQGSRLRRKATEPILGCYHHIKRCYSADRSTKCGNVRSMLQYSVGVNPTDTILAGVSSDPRAIHFFCLPSSVRRALGCDSDGHLLAL